MKAEHINPFINSVSEVFKSMLNCDVKVGKVEISEPKDCDEEQYIIGMIGMSGTARGVISMKFPEETAKKAVGKFVGLEFETVDSEVIDGIGELINIVAGNAKTKFQGHSISLSLPTVVKGSVYKLKNLGKLVWLSVPFSSEVGSFSIEVSFKPVEDPVKEVENASVSR
ncbi:MAG: chemotaxis protein CheX [candidate division Zixibacteria bacterium]|nr:chemotaxis protein CheX [candidate division Zixibacteria bacterium]